MQNIKDTDRVEETTLLPTALQYNFSSNDVVALVARKLEDGELDLADVAQLNKLKTGLEKLFKNERFRAFMEEERAKYGKEHPVIMGVTVQQKTVHTAWSFEDCNHPELTAWEGIAQQAASSIKALQEGLKLMEAGKQKEVYIERVPRIEWEESCELATVTAPTCTKKEGLAFTEK